MKTSKLLTSVMAFTMVLSVGGCSDNGVADGVLGDGLTPASNPAEFLENANEAKNYTTSFYVDEWLSNTITYSQYISGSYNESTMIDSLAYYGTSSYYYTVKYTEDAMLVDINIYGTIPYRTILYLNAGYSTYYGTYISYIFESDQGGNFYLAGVTYQWDMMCYSLFDAKTLGLLDESVYSLVGTREDEKGNSYNSYSISDVTTEVYLGTALGACEIYSGYYFYDITRYVDLTALYLYTGLQKLEVDIGAIDYWTINENYDVALTGYYFNTTIYDVGLTDISEEVDECQTFLDTYYS